MEGMFVPIFGTAFLLFFGVFNTFSIFGIWGFNPLGLRKVIYLGSMTFEEMGSLSWPAKCSLTNSFMILNLLILGVIQRFWYPPGFSVLLHCLLIVLSMILWYVALLWPRPTERQKLKKTE